MSRIFISYRRADSNTITGRIYDRLVNAFGAENVFKDVDDIPMGADFRSVLEREVASCNILLLVIGDHWLNIADPQGKRRLDDPDDFVRIEAEASLSRPDTVVIPVMVNGATMPKAAELPRNLQPLVYRNAAVVRDDPDFNRDTMRLIEQIKRHDPNAQTQKAPLPPSRVPAKPKRIIRAVASVIGIAAVVSTFVLATTVLNNNNITRDNNLLQAVNNNDGDKGIEPTDAPAPTSTSIPEPSATRIMPTATPLPTRTPPPEGVANLEFAQRNLPGYIPGSVKLEAERLPDLVEPAYQGSSQLYGSFRLGDWQEFVVVFDETGMVDGRLYVDLNSNRDLTDEQAFYIRSDQGDFKPIEFTIDYGEKRLPYSVRFEYFNDFNAEIGFFQLQYVIESYRQGIVYLGGKPYLIAVDDFNGNGIFNESDTMWDTDEYWLDLNGDGYYGYEDDFGASLASSVEIDGVCYGITDLSPGSDFIQMEELPRGTIEGTVFDNDSGRTIGGAQVEVDDKTSISSATGQYSLSLCPGYYSSLLVKRSGYVPIEMTDEQTGYYTVTQDNSIIDDVYMSAAPDAPSGQVTLSDGESYHFLTGERGYYSGGEFYVGSEDGQMKFWGNNDQRGITSLGNLGDVDLYTVSFCHLVETDYTRYGVDAVPGEVYVALAHAGEEGNFVVFQVREVLSNAVVLDYVYRDYC